jgi:hypothetical protein
MFCMIVDLVWDDHLTPRGVILLQLALFVWMVQSITLFKPVTWTVSYVFFVHILLEHIEFLF